MIFRILNLATSINLARVVKLRRKWRNTWSQWTLVLCFYKWFGTRLFLLVIGKFFVNLGQAEPGLLLKKTPTQVFSWLFCVIFKNTFFLEHLWATASGQALLGASEFYRIPYAQGKRKKEEMGTSMRISGVSQKSVWDRVLHFSKVAMLQPIFGNFIRSELQQKTFANFPNIL